MYSTVTDVRTALTPGGGSDDQSTAAGLADSQIEDAIREADAVIDSYINGLVIIPETQGGEIPDSDPVAYYTVAPYPVRWYSRDIAAWLATLTFKRNKDVTPDDPVRQRYNMAMNLLMRIGNGDFTLPNPPFSPPLSAGGDGGVFIINQYEGKLFGADEFGLTQGMSEQEIIRRVYGRRY